MTEKKRYRFRKYEFKVEALIIYDLKTFTFKVHPLNIPIEVSQKILEISECD